MEMNENEMQSIIEKTPWLSELLTRLYELTKQSSVRWAKTIKSIGEDDINLGDFVEVFVSQVDKIYTELNDDADLLHSKYVDKIEDAVEELSAMHKDLNLGNPDIFYKDFQEVPLARFYKSLEEKKAEIEELVKTRRSEYKEIRSQYEQLGRVLGRALPPLVESPLPNSDKLNELRSLIEELDGEKMIREEKFFKLREEILQMVQELNFVPNLIFEQKLQATSDFEVLITDDEMPQLEAYHQRLSRRLENIKEEVADLRVKIEELWSMLEVDITARNEFRITNVGHTQDTLEALRLEFTRCEELKKANMKSFIEKQRENIHKIWEKCHVDPKIRKQFVYLRSDVYNEDLLDLHELEYNKWQQYYISNEMLFARLEEHKNLWEQSLQLDAKNEGVDRYKNRGGQLLAEEKLRNKLQKRIPILEEKIINLAREFEANNGTPFLTFGNTVEKYLELLHAEKEKNFKLKLSAKKQMRDQQALSVPGSSHMNLFPSVTPTKTPLPIKRRAATPLNAMKTPKVARSAPAKPKLNISKARRLSKKIRKETRYRASLSRSASSSAKENNPKDSSTSYCAFAKEVTVRMECRSTAFGVDEKPPVLGERN